MPVYSNNEWKLQLINPDGTASGQPFTLASVGIESASFDLNSMAADVLTFTVGGRAIDAADLWPYGQLIALLDPAGVRQFFGRVEPWSREGRQDSQNHIGRLVNPWWYLERRIYEQSYRLVSQYNTNPALIQYATYTTPRVVLNVLFDGNTGWYSATTGQQIADAVTWAIAQGAPIALGTVDPATLPFSDFQKGIFCADVIKLMFRKEPDFIVDWDYTTIPFPTIHFRKKNSMTPLNIDLTDAAVREVVAIKPRPDWQRSYVKINYDQTNSTSNGQYISTYADWYSANGQGNATNGAATGAALPADTESKFNGVDLFCDLTGSATSSASQTATFASQGFDITDAATWQRWKPSLAAKNIAQVIVLGQRTTPAADAQRPAPSIATLDEYYGFNGQPIPYDTDCQFEVVDGEWADWIPDVKGQRVRISAWVMIKKQNGDVSYEQVTHDLTVVSQNTGAISTRFTQGATSVSQYAEPVPVGLAQSMWTSWQNLAIEGRFTNVQAVVGSTQITRSNSLNFLTANPGQNGQPDWRNVNALVQRISGDIATGALTVQFGAPLHITGNDLIDAVRATRYRVTTIDIGYLFGGAIGGGAAGVTFGRKTHARSTQHGATHTQTQVISQAMLPAVGVDPTITHDGTSGISSWVPPGAPVATAPSGQQSSQPTVIVDPQKAKGSDGNWHTLYIQEKKTCVTINGIRKQRTVLVLASDAYKAADDPT